MIRGTVLERGQQDPLESRGPRRRQEKETQETGPLLLSRPREDGSKMFRISQRREGELTRVGGRGGKASSGHLLLSLFFSHTNSLPKSLSSPSLEGEKEELSSNKRG